MFWWFFGGENHEFLGLKPFQPNSSMRGIDSRTKARIGRQFLNSGISPNDPEQAMSQITSDDFIKDSGTQAVRIQGYAENIRNIQVGGLPQGSALAMPTPTTLAPETSNNLLDINLSLKPKKPKKSKKPKNVINKRYPGESDGEAICRNFLERHYRKPFMKRKNLKWLKNPKTGKNGKNNYMELDGFNEELMIAFEYDGDQHYVYPHFFHKTEQDFRNLVQRDKDKLRLCDENGVYLMKIPYTVPNNLIEKFLLNILPPDIS